MAAVQTISGRQFNAVNNKSAGACAACDAKRSTTLPPGVYTLRLFEFNDYEAARDAGQRASALTPQRYRAVVSTSTVYLFRRKGDALKVEATLKGGASHTVTVRHEDEPAEFYACISHFPFPAARLNQFLGPRGVALAGRRCVLVAPGNTANVRVVAAQTYDVVMPDWRRIATDLHNVEATRLREIAAYANNATVAQKRMLAELTLQTAKSYERHNSKVWTWLERVPDPRPVGRPSASRPLGLTTQPWTQCEVDLGTIYGEARRLQLRAENAAQSKYAWMAAPGYNEMRWDSLTNPALMDNTVRAEATLFTPALETTAGRNYARDYAVKSGTWHDHYLQHMNDAAIQALRTNPSVAEAYWALLGVVGSAMMEYADKQPTMGDGEEPSDDRTSQLNDIRKNAGGAVDAGVKGHHNDAYKNPAEAAHEKYEESHEHAERAHEVRGQIQKQQAAGVAQTQAEANTARAAADDAERLANTPKWVMEKWVIKSIRRSTGQVPRPCRYNPSMALFVPTSNDFVGNVAVRTTEGADNPAIQRRATTAREDAARVDQRLRDRMAQAQQRNARAERVEKALAAKVEPARVDFVNAHEFEVQNRGAPWATSGMMVALQLLNLGLAIKTMTGDPSLENKSKLGGAVADLLYGFEFGFDAIVLDAKATASLATRAAGTGLMEKLLMGTRIAGVIGGSVSIWFSGRDAIVAFQHHDTALGFANIGAALGAAMLTATAMGAAGWLGTGTVAALVAGTSWTVIGAVIVLAAAAAIWYFSKPPMESWFLHCPWGTRATSASTDEQLKDLLQLLCTPGFSARQLSPAESPGGRPTVCLTLRPPMFFAGESTLVFDEAAIAEHGKYFAFDHFSVVKTSVRPEIGPLDARFLAHLTSTPVPLPFVDRGSHGGMHVSAYKDANGLAFEVAFPVSRTLNGQRGTGYADDAYKATGRVMLTLWNAKSGKEWERIHLAPMDMGPVLVDNTRSATSDW